jgi:cell division protein FtsX
VLGASGEGSLDALFGGVVGMIIGAGLFSEFYPKLEKGTLSKDNFAGLTWPQLIKVTPWLIIIPMLIAITALLLWVEKGGL